MAKWIKSKPSPSLLFHTKRNRDFGVGAASARLLFPMDHILKISTNNSMGQAAGSFQIVLVPYRPNVGSTEPFYYTAVQPLDVVEISLDGKTTTMMGVVDKVGKTLTVTREGVQEVVTIVGRSLGAIWEFDLIKYFTNAVGLSEELNTRNLNLQEGSIVFDYLGDPAHKAIMDIYTLLPTFEMELNNGQLNQYLDVGSELFTRVDEKIFATQISPYSGTVWDYFKKYLQPPFYELWTDSLDGKLFLRGRPTPYSVTEHVLGENPDGIRRPYSWYQAKNWIEPDINIIHKIPVTDVLSESINVDHGKAYSYFAILPSDQFIAKDAEYAAFPPLIDSDLAKEIGVRDMQVRLNYIPLTTDPDGRDNTIDKHLYYRNQLYLWNRDNHRMEEGSMTVRGNPDLRVGDRIQRTDTEKEYFIDTVSNDYEFGKVFTTTIRVGRGLTISDREKLYKAGDDFIATLDQGVS